MRKFVYAIVILLCVALGVSFAVLNATPVRVDLYVSVQHVPLALLLIATLCVGAVLGVTASMAWRLKARIELGRLRGRERDSATHGTLPDPVQGR